MSDGNGIDIGSMYGLLVEIGKAVSRHDAVLERHGAMLERHGAMLERHDALLERLVRVAEEQNRRLTALERIVAAIAADLAELKQTVTAYHASVVGQGIATAEHDARIRRIEDHLGLPPFVHG